jgi:hypothetical protein
MTIQSILSAIAPYLLSGVVIILQWSLKRNLSAIDTALATVGEKVDATNVSLLQYQTKVAEQYVSKTDCTNCSAKD